MNRWTSDHGGLAAESAIVSVVLIGFVAFIAYATMITSAGGNVADAAADGARAAAQASDLGATSAAQTAVNESLNGWCIGAPLVSVTARTPITGSGVDQLAVTVTCEVDLSSAGALSLPGTRTYTHTRSAIVDRYRGSG